MTLAMTEIDISLGGRRLFDRLSLTVDAGEVVTVMGPSGSGKSTLLAFVGGFLGPPFAATGSIRIDGSDVAGLPAERRRIGILFQDDLLFPHLSVGGNLAFGLPPSTRRGPARREAVDRALADAGLAGFAERDPATLSGGQRARVALMRTLVANPRVLLLDEPFAKLDLALRRDFRKFVFDHAAERRLPTLLVTHDETDAPAGGRVVDLGGAD